jgi:hypothetical protein
MAGSDGGAGTTGTAGSDGGTGTDGGGGLTNDQIINGPGAFGADYGMMLTHPTPKVYNAGTCM